MRLIHLLSCSLVCCISSILSNAQTVKLINSTEQGWSGGVAGKHGVRYTFVVKFSGFATEPIPDTIWVGREPTAIVATDKQQYANTKVTHRAKSVQFEIHVNINRDDNEYGQPVPQTKPKQPAPIAYKGVALLSYRNNKQRSYFEIRKIITHYDPISYP